jgi:hypothetical protein
LILQRLSQQTAKTIAPLIASLALFSAAQVVIFAHSKSLLDVANVAGMIFFGFAVVALIGKLDFAAVLPAAAVILTGVLIAGFHETYSDLPRVTFVLPVLAPLFASVGLLPGVQRRSVRMQWLLVLAVSVIPLLAAAIVAMSFEKLDFENA